MAAPPPKGRVGGGLPGLSRRHFGPAREARVGYAGIAVTIDTRELELLRLAMLDIGLSLQDRERVLAWAFNEGGERLQTALKRALTDWTAIRNQTQIMDALKLRRAYASGMGYGGRLEAKVVVATPWTTVTRRDFGAHQVNVYGVGHSAWGRDQTAKGAFMIPGAQPAFHRVKTPWGKHRSKMQVLYGPNLAREMERHPREVEEMGAWALREKVIPAAYRLIEWEAAKAKGRYGL